MTEIEQLQAQIKRLQRLAFIDELTGLFNRRAFSAKLDQEWARAQRDQFPIALLFLDLNGFKQINDTQGHSEGDRLLQSFAESLRSVRLRSYDFIARLGGDEFAIVLPDSGVYGAKRVAEFVCGIVKDVSVAVGVAAIVPDPSVAVSELIDRADKAMYEDKARSH